MPALSTTLYPFQHLTDLSWLTKSAKAGTTRLPEQASPLQYPIPAIYQCPAIPHLTQPLLQPNNTVHPVTHLPPQPTVLDLDDFATHLARMTHQWQPTLAKLPKPLNQLSKSAALPAVLQSAAAGLAFYYGTWPAIQNLWGWQERKTHLYHQAYPTQLDCVKQPIVVHHQRLYQRHHIDWYRHTLLLIASTGMGLSALCHALAGSNKEHTYLNELANTALSLAIPAQIVEACISIQQFAHFMYSPMLSPERTVKATLRHESRVLQFFALLGLCTCPAIIFGAIATSPWAAYLSTYWRSIGCFSLLTGVLSQPYFRGKLGWGDA